MCCNILHLMVEPVVGPLTRSEGGGGVWRPRPVDMWRPRPVDSPLADAEENQRRNCCFNLTISTCGR